MSEHRHTSGPWRVSDLTGDVVTATGEIIHDRRGDFSDRSSANARLIAAVPALLEALEEVEWVSGRCPFCGCDEGCDHWDECVINNALKLARGE